MYSVYISEFDFVIIKFPEQIFPSFVYLVHDIRTTINIYKINTPLQVQNNLSYVLAYTRPPSYDLKQAGKQKLN